MQRRPSLLLEEMFLGRRVWAAVPKLAFSRGLLPTTMRPSMVSLSPSMKIASFHSDGLRKPEGHLMSSECAAIFDEIQLVALSDYFLGVESFLS